LDSDYEDVAEAEMGELIVHTPYANHKHSNVNQIKRTQEKKDSLLSEEELKTFKLLDGN
jgi:hypothetical protein